ncbi:MAG: hypothetical protein HYW24_02365 [Candidatus Aenigmarchaeota archaeon]|nr:hypothetical protein [Candidatus Aenigmarchaeota archaeon]
MALDDATDFYQAVRSYFMEGGTHSSQMVRYQFFTKLFLDRLPQLRASEAYYNIHISYPWGKPRESRRKMRDITPEELRAVYSVGADRFNKSASIVGTNVSKGFQVPVTLDDALYVLCDAIPEAFRRVHGDTPMDRYQGSIKADYGGFETGKRR